MSGLLSVFHVRGIDQSPERYLGALRLLTHRGGQGEFGRLSPILFFGVRYNTQANGAGSQRPAVSRDGTVLLALDGHIHNREDVERDLLARGCRSDLSSDSALVLGAYLEYGAECFARLRGVWALMLWDARQPALYVSRGRIGVKPLYYFAAPRHLLIASEIKSIIALDPEARAIDQGRVRALVRFGRIDDWTGTCFAGIRPVAPGTYLRFDGERLDTRRYWTLSPATNPAATPEEVYGTLAAAIRRHTAPGIRTGLALSGGIDSSSIAGILASDGLPEARDVHAYSASVPKVTDESFLINATIRRTGMPHRYVSFDTLDHRRALDELIVAHDEPIQFSGVLYQFALRRRMADDGCRAVLVGYGADEIFAGYRHLAQPYLLALAAGGRLWDWIRFVLGGSEFVESSRGQLGYLALRGLLGSGSRRLRRSETAATEGSAGAEAEAQLPWEGGAKCDPLPGPGEFETQGLAGGKLFFHALLQCFRTNIPLLVRLEDRNAAANGLELCVPFLDDQLIEMALAFPFQRYMEGGWNKAVLRDAVRRVLAPEVRGYRRKLATPGNDEHLSFEILRPELLDLLSSESFYASGLWSRRSRRLYQDDVLTRSRASMWLRVYLTHRWYEQVVRSA